LVLHTRRWRSEKRLEQWPTDRLGAFFGLDFSFLCVWSGYRSGLSGGRADKSNCCLRRHPASLIAVKRRANSMAHVPNCFVTNKPVGSKSKQRAGERVQRGLELTTDGIRVCPCLQGCSATGTWGLWVMKVDARFIVPIGFPRPIHPIP
jgi:hypothetical protein